MDVESAKEIISDAEEVIRRKQKLIFETEMAIASHLCPFEIGQAVYNSEGIKEVVSSISYAPWSRPGYEIKTKKIKKDGNLYKESNHVWRPEEYKAVQDTGE